MEPKEVLKRIEDCGVVAVVRLSGETDHQGLCNALIDGGVDILEITMTSPNALEMIKELSETLGDKAVVGVGSVRKAEDVKHAVEAGAEFIVSPVLKEEIIRTAKNLGKAVIPGAYTPTEILQAWEWGADVVKVFPATTLGPKYFKDIHGPLPDIRMTPTGGVDLTNVAEFIKNGAVCVGVGSALLNKKMIADKDWAGLSKLAAQYVEQIKLGRGEK